MIKRHEERHGERPTSSLTQIMSEDLRTAPFQSRTTQLRTTISGSKHSNGVVVALNGEPLLLEYFSENETFKHFQEALINALPFDIFNESEIELSERSIREFIESCLDSSLTIRAKRKSGVHFEKSSHALDIRAYGLTDDGKELMHLLAVNLEHQTLVKA